MNKLKEMRQRAGLTQAQTAKAVGITAMTYQRYEYGKRYPDVLTAFRIADVLKVGNLREIWGGNPIPKV